MITKFASEFDSLKWTNQLILYALMYPFFVTTNVLILKLSPIDALISGLLFFALVMAGERVTDLIKQRRRK